MNEDEAREKTARAQVVSGLLVLAVGVVITVGTAIAASSGGVFVVTFGLIAAGAFRTARGVYALRTIRAQNVVAQTDLDTYFAPDAARARRNRKLRIAFIVFACIVPVVAIWQFDDWVGERCKQGLIAPTLEARRASMQSVALPLRLFRELPIGSFPYCAMVEGDLARVNEGVCPWNPIDGVSCRCGTTRVPEDVAGKAVGRHCDNGSALVLP